MQTTIFGKGLKCQRLFKFKVCNCSNCSYLRVMSVLVLSSSDRSGDTHCDGGTPKIVYIERGEIFTKIWRQCCSLTCSDNGTRIGH